MRAVGSEASGWVRSHNWLAIVNCDVGTFVFDPKIMTPIALPSTNIPHPAMSYPQAVTVGNLVFVAGQAGMNFESGTISPDFETQARQAFTNLSAVLTAADSGLDRVVKTTVWLVDAANFDCLNRLYAEYFPTNPPARSTPVVALPKKEFQISIEVIAMVAAE